ncbi:MAG TPA: hypothetical protein HA292_06115 [Candidatus Nitrosotenuis sp.]|jgi:hypothetical protein|nr:hypothetical protein [Candidatus Nitrosotenuis sp.]HIH68159.1 hypothetical protein [Candidatus Nitrosotenuis sp.]HII03316.1 hypothetical protein [Candidatus Nitrosotenuis sp.]
MLHKIIVEIPNLQNLVLELDDAAAPNTVSTFLQKLPFELKANVWGKEIYTEPAPFSAESENAKSVVKLYDVAFWPPGKALCLFYGPTPISTKDEIKPYSPVNVIGRVVESNIGDITGIEGRILRFTKS